jgi:tripartite-type tricarboxylate transporter receptor subunit TctC
MKRKRELLAIVLIFVLILMTCSGCNFLSKEEEVYPSRPISVVVWSSPGGAVDNIARGILPLLQKDLGVAIPITNIKGGVGSVGAEHVKSQKPDGYTFVFGSEALSTWQTMGVCDYSYPEDFVPVMIVALLTPALIVPPDSPYATAEEFFDYALAHPGELNIALTNVGTSGHIFSTMLKKVIGFDVNIIHFGTATDCITAVMGGEVDASFETVNACVEGHNSGLLKILATATVEPVDILNGVPGLAEVIPEMADYLPWGAYFGLYASSDVPEERIKVVADALERCIELDSWKEYADNLFITTIGLTGDEAGEYIKEWTAQTCYLMYDAGAAINNPADFGIERPSD